MEVVHESITDPDEPEPFSRELVRERPDLIRWLIGENPTYAPTIMELKVFYPAYAERLRRLKEAGVKLMHKVPSVRYGVKAEAVGADAVAIVGFECGGHPGRDDVTSLVLIPRLVKEVTIPVVAGGGFADGRGLAAALALGAEAVLMGTRFMATRECLVHSNFKDWMVTARETDTVVVERSIGNPMRARQNAAADRVLEMEAQGATLADLMPIIAGVMGREAYLSGDLDKGVIACGQSVSLIQDIPSVAELVDRVVEEAESTLRGLAR